MKTQTIDTEENLSDFVNNAIKSNKFENDEDKIPKEKQEQRTEENPINSFKLRQLEQKQQLLVGLTNILFHKLEEMGPKKEDHKAENPKKERKYAKIEFTDISWYKNLGSTQ